MVMMRRLFVSEGPSSDKGAAEYRVHAGQGELGMLSVFAGAVLRATAVILVVMLPSIYVGSASADAALGTLFLALSIGFLVFVEYNADAPSFIEFRDAPPVNLIRFTMLALTVVTLSLGFRDDLAPSMLTGISTRLMAFFGSALDLPYSPVHLFGLAVPSGTSGVLHELIIGMAAVAAIIGFGAILCATAIFWLLGWPLHGRSFNLWVNLPSFEPISGTDTAKRLTDDATRTLVIAFLMPFALPALASYLGAFPSSFDNFPRQTIVWMVAIWAFLPTSMAIRGIALFFVVRSINAQRRRIDARREAEL